MKRSKKEELRKPAWYSKIYKNESLDPLIWLEEIWKRVWLIKMLPLYPNQELEVFSEILLKKMLLILKKN